MKTVQADAENEESEDGAESETDDEERDEADDEDKYDERDEEDYDDYPEVIWNNTYLLHGPYFIVWHGDVMYVHLFTFFSETWCG